jgi:hypothetical protein
MCLAQYMRSLQSFRNRSEADDLVKGLTFYESLPVATFRGGPI